MSAGGRRSDERGFTLIELMVVVLIISVLMAIAIPTFTGVTARARNRSAQLRLRNAMTAAKAAATDNEGRFEESDGSPVTPASLGGEETSFDFVTTGVTEENVGFRVGNDPDDLHSGGSASNTMILFWTHSRSGKWFGLRTTRNGVLRFCEGLTESAVDDFADCTRTSW